MTRLERIRRDAERTAARRRRAGDWNGAIAVDLEDVQWLIARVDELEAEAEKIRSIGHELMDARPNLRQQLLDDLAVVRRAAARQGGAR